MDAPYPFPPGLADARVVRTPVFDQISQRLGFTAAHRGALLIVGRPGTGKSVALTTCLTELATDQVMITAPPRLTAKDTVRLLYDALHPTRDVFDLRHMQDDLADTLAAQPRVLVIEEAHLLTTDAADQLHYLQHRPGAQWSLVLEGGPHLLTPIRNSAGLYGDVLATVEVTRFHDPADAVAAIRQMHPMFTYADQKLLLTLDQQICQGRWRTWTQLLQAALHLHARTGDTEPATLDRPLAQAAIALLPRTLKPKK